MKTSTSPIEYSSVRFTGDEIFEIDSKNKSRRILSIQKVNIEAIILKYGVASERPALDISLGVFFLSISIFMGVPLLCSYMHIWPTVFHPLPQQGFTNRYGFAPILLFPFAVVMLYAAFRKRLYFEVHTNKGIRKIVFEKNATRSMVEKLMGILKVSNWGKGRSIATPSLVTLAA